MSVQKQCAYWVLTIHEGASCFYNLNEIIQKLVDDNPNIEYYYIRHNPDDDSKSIHYHLVLYFKGKVKRFSTIESYFPGSHIEQTNKQRYIRCIQYLIHKNNPEKQQYKTSEIISNVEKSLLDDLINSNGYEYELFIDYKIYDYLAEFYQKYKNVNIGMFIQRFGLGALRQYYFIIKDIIKDFMEDIYKFTYSNGKKQDKIFKQFSEDNPDIELRKEFALAKAQMMIDEAMDFDEFKNMLYSGYVSDIESGYIKLH